MLLDSFLSPSAIFQEEPCHHEENEVDLSVSRATGSLLCDKGRGQRSNIWQLLVAAICRTFSNQNLSSCNLLILLTDDFYARIQQLCAVELMHYKHFAKEILSFDYTLNLSHCSSIEQYVHLLGVEIFILPREMTTFFDWTAAEIFPSGSIFAHWGKRYHKDYMLR